MCQLPPTGGVPLIQEPSAAPESGLFGVLVESLKLLVILVAPFVGFAVVIHWFERITQTRMAERFGWHSVLWTGWLGTPIHELSHAFMCRLFRHRVDEIALFEPDRESGRLGYVKHSFQEGNWYQELGHFFIGIAPLIGGSSVLAIFLWMFYPDAAKVAIEAANSGAAHGAVAQVVSAIEALCGNILTIAHLGTVRFWVFIYLVLCVGSHMAPSSSDYRGASRGVFLLGGILVAIVLLLAWWGVDSETMMQGMVGILGPLFAILGLTIVLCGFTTAIVYLVTMFIPVSYRVTD